MTDMNGLQNRLAGLKREYRGIRCMIEMMEKGTPREELRKIRTEKLKPLEAEIKKLEGEIAPELGTQDPSSSLHRSYDFLKGTV